MRGLIILAILGLSLPGLALAENPEPGVKEELARLRKLVESTQERLQRLEKSLQAVTAEKTEKERHRKELDAARDRAKALVMENARLRDELVAAQITARSLKARNEQLEAQLQQLARDLARMKALRGEAAPAKPEAKEGVEGVVTKVEGNLATLSVGSDAGLKKGVVLEAFRLEKEMKYLGRVRIVEVAAKSSVAQALGRLSAALEKGDRVATKLPAK